MCDCVQRSTTVKSEYNVRRRWKEFTAIQDVAGERAPACPVHPRVLGPGETASAPICQSTASRLSVLVSLSLFLSLYLNLLSLPISIRLRQRLLQPLVGPAHQLCVLRTMLFVQRAVGSRRCRRKWRIWVDGSRLFEIVQPHPGIIARGDDDER